VLFRARIELRCACVSDGYACHNMFILKDPIIEKRNMMVSCGALVMACSGRAWLVACSDGPTE